MLAKGPDGVGVIGVRVGIRHADDDRPEGAVVASAGHVGTNAGQFENLHNIAIDSKGNIYTAEVQGKRIQRFLNTAGL